MHFMVSYIYHRFVNVRSTLGPAEARHRFGKKRRAACPRVNTRNSTMEAVNLQKETLQLRRVYFVLSLLGTHF